MTTAARTPTTAKRSDLRDQAERLIQRGLPACAGMTDDGFRDLVAPLGAHVPNEPFVLVVTGTVVPLDRLIELAVLEGKRGFTTMETADVARFTPTPDLNLPQSPVYLVTEVETGRDTLGVRPDDALPRIHAEGRTPLTLDEGLAVAIQHPEWLRERNCFEMLGSRAGDKRVTGIWVSKRAPRLGWCWGGNPHTWLGMGSAARRIPSPTSTTTPPFTN